ncbi:DUF362 domain-containing protein [Methanosphaerula subterraneus]|uniref:DUF362 domain-containing protein n=1 Tax=Methanosphaerula subterraneus TaxID=3350244 RepID=UPI003F8341BF
MASPVYFARVRARSPGENKISRVRALFERAGFAGHLVPGETAAIKLHFGEAGGDGYINPVLVRQVVDKVKESGSRPFLTDTNTLYLGSRSDAVDHITTAVSHGFDYAVVNAPVIIADGLRGGNVTTVPVQGKHFSSVKIAGDIAAARSMIVLSHFKGHEVAGFGGAIKNLAMGCASPAGKREQHSARPTVVRDLCIGCQTCLPVCPQEAIGMDEGAALISKDRCIGCFECMTVCPEHAIDVDWETDIPTFTERMVEYAAGAAKTKEGRVGYMNFLLNITPDCDCVPWSDRQIVPDIGILASNDPVAIDAASFDLVNEQIGFSDSMLTDHFAAGEDKFTGLRCVTDGRRQVQYAEEIGLGTRAYDLIEI